MEVNKAIKFIKKSYTYLYVSYKGNKKEIEGFDEIISLLQSMEAKNKALKEENEAYKGMWEEFKTQWGKYKMTKQKGEPLKYLDAKVEWAMKELEQKYLGGGE